MDMMFAAVMALKAYSGLAKSAFDPAVMVLQKLDVISRANERLCGCYKSAYQLGTIFLDQRRS
jgi:hypothetical protein